MLKFRRGLLAATATGLLAAGLTAGVAEARTNRALIVAATKYPNLPKKNWLTGPNNDAQLIREYLIGNPQMPFAESDVTVLADGLDFAKTSPTLAAIKAQMKAVAEASRPGDFFYVHFSGHGSQQPERVKGKETDGLDEIFLPSDTELWKDKTTGVPNALVDDEIGEMLDAIRAKGSFVWFVIDACNSGTATRAVVEDTSSTSERKIEPADLGIDPAAMAQAQADAAAAAPASRSVGPGERESALGMGDEATPQSAEPARGGLVAFYAAQTTETTPERPMPRGVDGATSYGVFTYTLFQRLAENPGMTYRQLGQSILQQYAADRQDKPTPLFEGQLDARVFGTETTANVMQWPIKSKDDGSIDIPAGLLQRLTPGTKLAILPSPAAETKDAVGYIEVTDAKNLSSRARMVAYDGKGAMQLSAMPPQAYARLSDLAVNFRLTVSRPTVQPASAREAEMVNAMLDGFAKDGEKRFNIELVDAGKDADLKLAIEPENKVNLKSSSNKPALFFLPPSGQISTSDGSKPPLVAIDTANPERLAQLSAENLQKIFRATSLARLSVASDYQPDQVSVQFRIKRENKEGMEPLDGSSVPYVSPGDQVHVLAENKSNRRVDINVLYVGSDYSITHITAQRLEAGAKLDEGLLQFTADSFGMERMIAVLTDAPAGSETEDLSFLAQAGVPPASRAVGGAAGGFSSMFGQIAQVPASRGATAFKASGGDSPKGAVMIFGVETQPRSSN